MKALEQRARTAKVSDELRQAIGPNFANVEDEFSVDLETNLSHFAAMIRDLMAWLSEQLKSHKCISVLGL
jgi:hypothetical protein